MEMELFGGFSAYINTYKLTNTTRLNVLQETRNVASALNTTDGHLN